MRFSCGQFMMQTDDFSKRKNILDLEHQAHINYFNIVSISFITITFTIIWSYFIDKINLELLIGGLAFAGSLFMTVLTLIFSKIKNIKEQIKNL